MTIGKPTTVLLLVALGAGCARNSLGSFAAASTREQPPAHAVLAEQISGRNCKNQIFGYTTGGPIPSLDRAVENALAQVPGADALADASFFYEATLLFLYNRVCVRVTGKAVATASAETSPPSSPGQAR